MKPNIFEECLELLPQRDNPQRELIFQAAWQCFARKGIKSTVMDDIAREAGVSRPSIYYYFKDKQSLIVEAVIREEIESYQQRCEEGFLNGEGLCAIIESAAHGVVRAHTNPHIQLLTHPEAERYTAKAIGSEMTKQIQAKYWGALLDDARALGELREDLSNEEMTLWIILMQHHMTLNGELMGCSDFDSVYLKLKHFLAPALSSSAKLPKSFVKA